MQNVSSLLFHLLISGARRIITVVDSVRLALDQIGPGGGMRVPAVGEPVAIPAGERVLAGWYVPGGDTPRAAVLIFHGIGDRIDYWRTVQLMLREHQLASLVFDYAGFGRSEGQTTPENLEADGRAAYAWLDRASGRHLPIFVLGFSLGTGVLAEIAGTLSPEPTGVVFCEAYATFRKAAERIVAPFRMLSRLLPDIWRTERNLSELDLPVLLVHGTEDKLFAPEIAKRLYALRNSATLSTKLALIPHCAHNDIYRRTPEEYWSPVLEFFSAQIQPPDLRS